MLSNQDVKEHKEESSTLSWMWHGILDFTKYAVQHPGKMGLGLLLLRTPIVRAALNNSAESIRYPDYTPPSGMCTSNEIPFEEYLVSTKSTYNQPPVYPFFGPLPISISPSIQLDADSRLPKDNIFTKDYLKNHHAKLEKKNYYMRGDGRTPEGMGDKIPPKCSVVVLPHYNVSRHRDSSECSGFVSLTDKPTIAHEFGSTYSSGSDPYHVYVGEMEWGLIVDDSHDVFPEESEHSAIGAVPIVSYRACTGQYNCGNIFVRPDLDSQLKEKIVDAQLMRHETATLKTEIPKKEKESTKNSPCFFSAPSAVKENVNSTNELEDGASLQLK